MHILAFAYGGLFVSYESNMTNGSQIFIIGESDSMHKIYFTNDESRLALSLAQV